MKRLLSAIILSAFLGIFGMANSSIASTITPTEGTWYGFGIGSIGSYVSDNYTFTISETKSFYVTDAYRIGDQFEVFNYDGSSYTSLGATSYKAPSTAYSISNPQEAYDSGYYSTGEFILNSGTYNIYLKNLGPWWSGAAYVKLGTSSSSSTVPEPATALLFGLGILGLAGVSRKKK